MTDVENITFSIEKVYATKRELLLYLNLLGNLKLHPELHFPSLKEHYLDTNPIIQRFLQYDSSYCLADKYLIAMVFIYFKRAQLSPQDYTYLNFFAGLCLAQSMEEDIDLSPNIYPWALGKYVQNELPNLLELKSLLWQAMDHRAAVSYHCCTQLISISNDHYVWKRERSSSFLEFYTSKYMRCLPLTSKPRKLKRSRRNLNSDCH